MSNGPGFSERLSLRLKGLYDRQIEKLVNSNLWVKIKLEIEAFSQRLNQKEIELSIHITFSQ